MTGGVSATVRDRSHDVEEWLREQIDQPRAVFRAAERLAAGAAAPAGLHAFTQGIDLLAAIPLDEMRAAEGFEAFFEQRLPQLTDKVARNRQRHLDALRDQQ